MAHSINFCTHTQFHPPTHTHVHTEYCTHIIIIELVPVAIMLELRASASGNYARTQGYVARTIIGKMNLSQIIILL